MTTELQHRFYSDRPVKFPSKALADEYDQESPGESWRKFTIIENARLAREEACAAECESCSL